MPFSYLPLALPLTASLPFDEVVAPQVVSLFSQHHPPCSCWQVSTQGRLGLRGLCLRKLLPGERRLLHCCGCHRVLLTLLDILVVIVGAPVLVLWCFLCQV